MFPGALLNLLVVLLIVGVVLWGISQIPGIDGTILRIVRVVIIVFVAIYLIYFFAGMLGSGPSPGFYPYHR
jgi:hypothetical protein